MIVKGMAPTWRICMSKRRRTKRGYEIAKRCHCTDRSGCDHHWWLRVHAAGKRQRIDLTALFPGDVVEVAAAKAKDLARRGLIADGRIAGPAKDDTRLTLADVADHYTQARGGKKQYYLDGLCATETEGPNGFSVKLATKPIDEVTTADIKHAVKMWRTRKRTLAGVRKGAVAERHLLQAARHLFNWAIEEGYAARTPFLSSQGTKLIHLKTTKGRTRRLEEGEEARIIASGNPFILDLFRALIETGCRPGELRTLQYSEVQADHIVVLASKAKDREERKIPIMPTLRAILDRRKIGPDGCVLPMSAYVFGTETGEMLSRRTLCGLWKDTCDAAGIKDLHLHDLRGEAGSQLLEAGVPIHEVRDALGHSSTTMTSTYLRTRTNSLTQAFERRTAHRARQALKRVV